MKQRPDDESLLRAALRTRPESAEQLAKIARRNPSDTASALERLGERGLLRFDGERIEYAPPSEVTAEQVLNLMAAQLESTQRMLATVGSLTGRLAESLGSAASQNLSELAHPIEVLQGPSAASEALLRLTDPARRGNRVAPELFGMLPTVELPQGHDLERDRAHWNEMARRAARVRVIVPDPPASHGVEPLLALDHPPMQARTVVHPPSWLWADLASGEVALPIAWGHSHPTTVIVVSNPAATALAAALFDAVWRTARPLTTNRREPRWAPMLHLMRQGLSLDEAAEHLGINPRTARRRLEGAMDHFGVETLFGLGAAWGAELVGGSIPVDDSAASGRWFDPTGRTR